MNSRNFLRIFGVVALAAFALAACRAEEQGRITGYKPGVYLGKKDTTLSAAQVETLAERAAEQGDSTYRAVGGGGEVVRPPVNAGALGDRVQMQGGGKQP